MTRSSMSAEALPATFAAVTRYTILSSSELKGVPRICPLVASMLSPRGNAGSEVKVRGCEPSRLASITTFSLRRKALLVTAKLSLVGPACTSITRLAVIVPAGPVAATVTTCPLTTQVGAPLISPVFASIVSPAGKLSAEKAKGPVPSMVATVLGVIGLWSAYIFW